MVFNEGFKEIPDLQFKLLPCGYCFFESPLYLVMVFTAWFNVFPHQGELRPKLTRPEMISNIGQPWSCFYELAYMLAVPAKWILCQYESPEFSPWC